MVLSSESTESRWKDLRFDMGLPSLIVTWSDSFASAVGKDIQVGIDSLSEEDCVTSVLDWSDTYFRLHRVRGTSCAL